MKNQNSNDMAARGSRLPAPICSALIVPNEDEGRDILWWQYINQHGTHMTKVVCRRTGYSVESNQYGVGGLATVDLDRLVASLRRNLPQNVEAWRGAGQKPQTDTENDRK